MGRDDAQNPSLWQLTFQPNARATRRLICFPHAGGSPAVYRPWAASFGDEMEVTAVQLPGRAARFRETSHTAMEQLATATAESLFIESKIPSIFFGHSLGGLLAYEVLCRWLTQGRPLPKLLVVSGVHAPHVPPRRTGSYRLSDDEFIASLAAWNGTPKEVLAHRELLELLLPSLRADFCVYETYAPTERTKLPIPILVLGGDNDPCTDEAGLAAWDEYSTVGCEQNIFPGDHFFIHAPESGALNHLRQVLLGPPSEYL